jgi:N-acetylglucosaminyl-diphospho-decaprenol L-rhamnosyltransferase
VKVSAVVVSHGHAAELERLLPALAPQVDELVVIGNVPGSLPENLQHSVTSAGSGATARTQSLQHSVTCLVNARPRSLAANVNAGIAATSGELVLSANPDAVPEPGAVDELRRFLDTHPRCGIAGPQMRYADGSWQPSRRRFPTVGGTLVRRTPLRRVLAPSRRHYLLGERPKEPVQADWMLGAFLLMRREMLDEIGGWDGGFRHYGEDIDLCYRAAKAGWERWYVPAAVVRHDYAAVIDRRFLTRHTLWHLRGMARFVRKHPERLLALR